MNADSKPHSTLYRYDVKFMDGEDWVGVEDHRALIARYNDLVEQLEAAHETLRQIQAMQPKRVQWYRDNGIVFDRAPNGERNDWQNIAFWVYTDLCEVESIARSALESNPASGPDA